MKKLIKLCMFLLVTGLIAGCERNISEVRFQEGTAPVLTANRTTIPLSFTTQANEALMLTWTNPNYTFSTGISSHPVTYKIEIDTTGANFTNPAKKVIVVSGVTELAITQAELNDYLLNQLTLSVNRPHAIEIRVIASLNNNALPLVSNTLKYTVTPYAIPPKVTPPASGKLFIVGNATPGGWNNPVPAPAQEFKKLSETMYEITLPLVAGNSYLLLPVNGSWDTKYGFIGANNENNTMEDDFKLNGGDLKAPAASGNYKIVVDFQRGKFTLTKL